MMHKNELWKIVGKIDGINIAMYEDGDYEYVTHPLSGDVVEFDDGELAVISYRNKEIKITMVSNLDQQDQDSYRFQ